MAREYVKCWHCKEPVHVNERIQYEHTTYTGKSTQKRNAHKECYESWKEDYDSFGSLREVILKIFKIPQLDQYMIQDLRDLRNGEEPALGRKGKIKEGYDYALMERAFIKKNLIIKHHLKAGKPWRYVFAIIKQCISELHREMEIIKEQTDTTNDNIVIHKIDESKRVENKIKNNSNEVDITTLFE